MLFYSVLPEVDKFETTFIFRNFEWLGCEPMQNSNFFAETGTRWKDYILVTLLLSAIIGCWYAYQQNKNAKRHLRRMAQDMEGLQKAEIALTEMQKVTFNDNK